MGEEWVGEEWWERVVGEGGGRGWERVVGEGGRRGWEERVGEGGRRWERSGRGVVEGVVEGV